MPDNNRLDDIFTHAKPLEDEDAEFIADLAGYQVTRAELFSHLREPEITIWPTRIRFNMACLRRFPGVTHTNPDSPRAKTADYPPLPS